MHDGDGSISMHLGSLITAAKQKNLIHIVLNNRVMTVLVGANKEGCLDLQD